MLYCTCSSYVVGSSFSIFSAEKFFDGLLVFFPVVLLFAPVCQMLSIVRHSSKNKVISFVTVAVLSLSSWFFIVPVCAHAVRSGEVFYAESPSSLTPGYFRTIRGRIYYFSAVHGNYVDAVRFNEDFSEEADVKIVKNRYMFFERDKNGFSDPIIGGYLEVPPALSKLFLGIFSIEKHAFNACSKGAAEWLCFSTIMLALISAGILVSVSTWRMVSVFWILFATSGVFIANYLCLNSFFDSLMHHFEKFGTLFIFIKDNLHFVINCTAVIFIVFTGSVFMLINSRLRHGGRK